MTRSEISYITIQCFLSNIERIKISQGITEYRIMKNCTLLQPDFKQRGIISQVRSGSRKIISLNLCLFIAKANNATFIIN